VHSPGSAGPHVQKQALMCFSLFSSGDGWLIKTEKGFFYQKAVYDENYSRQTKQLSVSSSQRQSEEDQKATAVEEA